MPSVYCVTDNTEAGTGRTEMFHGYMRPENHSLHAITEITNIF